MGILVTPLHEKGIKEDPLFYEELMVYSSGKNKLLRKHFILSGDTFQHSMFDRTYEFAFYKIPVRHDTYFSDRCR